MGQFKQDLGIKNTLGAVKTDIFLNIAYVYDALWTIALALNLSISILEERGLGRLKDFTYDSVEVADVFTEAFLHVSFVGASVSGSYLAVSNLLNTCNFYTFSIRLTHNSDMCDCTLLSCKYGQMCIAPVDKRGRQPRSYGMFYVVVQNKI